MSVKVRLTKRRKDGSARMSCSRCPDYQNCNGNCLGIAVNRLAEIEDILGQEYDLDNLEEVMDGSLPIKVEGFAPGGV